MLFKDGNNKLEVDIRDIGRDFKLVVITRQPYMDENYIQFILTKLQEGSIADNLYFSKRVRLPSQEIVENVLCIVLFNPRVNESVLYHMFVEVDDAFKLNEHFKKHEQSGRYFNDLTNVDDASKSFLLSIDKALSDMNVDNIIDDKPKKKFMPAESSKTIFRINLDDIEDDEELEGTIYSEHCTDCELREDCSGCGNCSGCDDDDDDDLEVLENLIAAITSLPAFINDSGFCPNVTAKILVRNINRSQEELLHLNLLTNTGAALTDPYALEEFVRVQSAKMLAAKQLLEDLKPKLLDCNTCPLKDLGAC